MRGANVECFHGLSSRQLAEDACKLACVPGVARAKCKVEEAHEHSYF